MYEKKTLKFTGVIKEDMQYTKFLYEKTENSKIDTYFQINFFRFLFKCIHSTNVSSSR